MVRNTKWKAKQCKLGSRGKVGGIRVEVAWGNRLLYSEVRPKNNNGCVNSLHVQRRICHVSPPLDKCFIVYAALLSSLSLHSHPLYPAARSETSKAPLTVFFPVPSKRLMSGLLVVPGLPGLRSQAAFVHLQFRALSWGTPTSGSSTCLSLSKWFLGIVPYRGLFWLIDLLSKSKVSSTQGQK